MANCGSKYVPIPRPTQAQYDQLKALASADINMGAAGCAGGGTPCHSPVAPHDRKLKTRKYREKVREDLRDFVLLKLGAPRVKIELDQQQLDADIDRVLMIFEEYAGREYFDYYTFMTTPGKSVYKMPDEIGVVREVVYKKEGTFGFQSTDMDGAIPIEYYYPGGAYSSIQGGLIDPIQPIWGRAGEWTLYKMYEQMFSRLSSNIGSWEWVSDLNYIKLYPTPHAVHKVGVHFLQKCKDWRQVNQAMQDGVLAHVMITLGNVRGKYAQPPGPGGGMQLDGEWMRTKGYELLDKWYEDLLAKFGDLGPGITMF